MVRQVAYLAAQPAAADRLTNGAVSPNLHLSLGKQDRAGPESAHRAVTLRPHRLTRPVHLLASYQIQVSYHITNLRAAPLVGNQ